MTTPAAHGHLTDFVRACREFSDPAADQSRAGRTLLNVTEVQIPQTYRIPFATVYPHGGGKRAEHERGIWHELVQHLHDLRYLPRTQFLAYHAAPSTVLRQPERLYPILAAVRRYLEEERHQELFELPTDEAAINLRWLNRNLTALTERLGLYTSWEGELPPPRRFARAHAGCYHRSLAYRMRVLSTEQHPLPEMDSFDPSALPALRHFAREVLELKGRALRKDFRSPPPQLWRTLGNIDLLIGAAVNRGLFPGKQPVIYQLPPSSPAAPPEGFTEADIFDEKTLRQFSGLRSGQQLLRRARRTDRRDRDALYVRLLQLKLWQTSYYVGAVDGDWGPVSHAALRAFVAEGVESTDKLRLKRKYVGLLLPVNRDKRIFMADFRGLFLLFRDLGKEVEAGGSPLASGGEGDLIDDLRRQGVRSMDIDRSVLAEKGVQGSYPNIREHPERRVSFPGRRTLGRLRQRLGTIVRWIKTTVRKLVDRLVGIIFGFVKLVLRRVRMAISRYLTGFRYLADFILGRPLETIVPAAAGGTPVVFSTRMQLDFDTITYASTGFRREDVRQHRQLLADALEGMGYFIDTTVRLIRFIGSLGSIGGWVKLGLAIGRFLFSGR